MSTKPRIYLDFNASAPLLREARDSMAEAMALVGNPSSIHAEGRAVRDRVERARNTVAALVGRPREQIVFTSGGTEANHLGVLGLAAIAEKRGLPRVVATTPIEHPSLRGAVDTLAARGWTVHRLAVDGDGRIQLPDRLTPLGVVALAAVNHELGTMVDANTLAWARDSGALVHVDAVQAVGKTSFGGDYPDAIAISAHKLGGPMGIGAVAIRVDDALPIVDGGHQERGRRAGTENVVGIVGVGAAAAVTADLDWAPVKTLGRRLEDGLLAMGARVHAGDAPRVGGTVNAGFAGALGESIVIALDLAGVAVSTGAACTSGSVQPSPVLLGIGMPAERAREAVRFSLGRSTTAEEIDEVLRILPALVDRARRG